MKTTLIMVLVYLFVLMNVITFSHPVIEGILGGFTLYVFVFLCFLMWTSRKGYVRTPVNTPEPGDNR